jgi:hypothetical protein
MSRPNGVPDDYTKDADGWWVAPDGRVWLPLEEAAEAARLRQTVARVQALADELETRYPEAGPHTQRLLAAIATDIRATITDALKGDQ